MRYTLGDKPFHDEIIASIHPFDILFSFVFKVYPGISLLELCYLGIILHLLASFLLFLLLSRYAPPFLVALLCGIMFLMNNFYGIKFFSYNSLSSDFSMISMVIWLYSLITEKLFISFLFGLLSGVFLGLAVFSYPPLVVLIAVPLSAIFIGLYYPQRYKRYFKPSIIFIITFILFFLTVFILLALFGLIPDFIEAFLDVKSSPFSKNHYSFSLAKLYDVWHEFLYFIPRGLGILTIVMFPLVTIFWSFKGRKSYYFYGGIVAVAVTFIIYGIPRILTKHITMYATELAHYSNFANVALVAFSILLGLLTLFLNNIYKKTTWREVANLVILWSGCSLLIYTIFSGNSFRASSHGGMPLFIIGMLAIYKLAEDFAIAKGIEKARIVIWRSLFYLIAVVFLITAANYYYRYIYRDSEIDKLTAKFTHTKLKGIYSQPKKVRAIEELLDYLKNRVKPGDYLLTYNDLGILNYLTDTRPSYSLSYVTDWWLPVPIREKLLKRMVDEERVPEYVIKLLVVPENDWQTLQVYKNSLIDNFVKSHYYLEKTIYPFEIWRKGEKPKFWAFEQVRPDFYSDFRKWNGPTTIDMNELSNVIPPLVLHKAIGSFKFTHIPDKSTGSIHTLLSEKDFFSGEEVQFGYILNENGINLKLRPEEEVIFLISARISNEENSYPYYRAELLIEDEVNRDIEKNSVPIFSNSWDDYIVSKKIRKGAEKVHLGIRWWPKTGNEWLEVKNVRVFIKDAPPDN